MYNQSLSNGLKLWQTDKPVSKLWQLQFFCSCSPLWLTSRTLQDPPIYLAHPSHRIPAGLGLLPIKPPKGDQSWAADATSTQKTVVTYRPWQTSHPATQGPFSVRQDVHRLQPAPKPDTQPPRESKARQQTLLKHRGQLQLIGLSLLSTQPPQGLAQLSVLLSQLQGPAATYLFVFLQKCPADVMQGEALSKMLPASW